MAADLNSLVRKDQTIKIVPSVEESLRKLNVNTELEETTQLWFNNLRLKWKAWKKSPSTDSHFDSLFQITEDPYTVALVCSVKCEEFKDCKPKSLPYYIIDSIYVWSQTNGKTPVDSLKLPAFEIAINQRNQQFLNLVIKTYHVNTIKDTILPIVKDMIRNDNCKQASQIVIAMDLFDEIPVENLMFPLILQDKRNVIDDYLSECPNQVRPLLLFLDRLLDKTFSIKDYAHKYIEENKVCHVKYDKIHYKSLGKLVARLCNRFNIPIETCKNLSKNRTTGGLRYLIYQKYVVHNVSSLVWDDLVKDSLHKSGCANEFIDMLAEYDAKEALKWASHFQLPEDSLPLALKNLSLKEEPATDEKWDEHSDNQQNFYKLPLPDSSIIIINSAEKLYDIVTNLVNCSIVSIDCEWKPSFGAMQSQVALIQIATFDCIYLIDTLILNTKQYASFWYGFNRSLLDNGEIIKVGFGLEQDLKEMKASINGLGNIKVKGEGLLDLCLLWKSLINFGLSLPSDSDNGGNSLSSLVQACFGVPLEKAEQCSNWELRPLRSTQINYAAIDAYVLLDIYRYLQKLCNEQEINFEEICNYVMTEKKMKIKKTKVVDRLQESTVNFQKCSRDVQVIVEPELAYLTAYLRYCDIDTIGSTPPMLWHDIVNLAISENRLILTAKLKLTPTARFSQSYILDICKDSSIKEQVQKILSNFNIVIEERDLLKRCLYCNGKELTKMTPNEVKDLCNKYAVNKNSESCRNYNNDVDDDAYYDNFLDDSDGDDCYLYQPVTKQSFANKSEDKVCLTSKGATIYINDVCRLSASCKPAILCELCGNIHWDEDPVLKSALEQISPFINLSK